MFEKFGWSVFEWIELGMKRCIGELELKVS